MIAYLLNILDLLLTLYALDHGAVELNPLMQNIPFQIGYKTIVVGVLCWWLSTRQERIAQCGMKLITAVYAALVAWHIVHIF